jgi:hypothetical protein
MATAHTVAVSKSNSGDSVRLNFLAICALAIPGLLVAKAPATAQGAFAPEDLFDAIIEFDTQWGSSGCAGFKPGQSVAVYGSSGRYSDIESTGELVDAGNYVYERLGPAEARVTYHTTIAGTWNEGDLIELMHFESATVGSFEGAQVDGKCTYSGRFKIKQ